MKNKFPRALIVIFLAAVAVRILPATYHFVIGTDEALYLTLAGHFAAGDGFTADGIHPHSEFDPGYPLFGALVYKVSGIDPFVTNAEGWRLELPARVNLLLLGSLLAIPIYFLALAFDRDRKDVAWRAAILTATLPALVLGVPNFEAASEQLYALALWFGWLGLWLGLEKRRGYWFVLSGFAFGVAHLTRWEGIVSGAIAILVALGVVIQSRAQATRSYRLTPLVVLIGILLLAAPYAIYQTARTGSIFSTKSIVHQLHGEALNSPDPFAWEKSYDNYERVRKNPALYPPLPVYLWEHREQTIINYGRNTFTQLKIIFTSPTILFLIWLPFAILGARRMTRRQNFFLVATILPALTFPISVVDARYLLPLLPAGMIWTAQGLIALKDRSIKRWSGEALGRWATIGLIALFVAVDIGAMFFIPRPIEYRAAGLALRGQIPANAPVLMRKRQIAFYSNTAYEWIPFSDVQGVLDDGQTKGADYFVIDSATTLATRPQLVYLLDETHAPSLIRVFYKTGGDTDQVIVYQIVK